jgi:3-hydroxyacyl-[acyl-carrier-protein] dehydratase
MPDAIQSQLPHRSPLLLVDRVLVREPGVRVVAEKRVSAADPAFPAAGMLGMPATLLLELLAQAGGFLEAESLHGREIFLAGIQDARFEGRVRPGDRLEVEVRPEAAFGTISRIHGEVRRDGEVLCSARLLLRRGSA